MERRVRGKPISHRTFSLGPDQGRRDVCMARYRLSRRPLWPSGPSDTAQQVRRNGDRDAFGRPGFPNFSLLGGETKRAASLNEDVAHFDARPRDMAGLREGRTGAERKLGTERETLAGHGRVAAGYAHRITGRVQGRTVRKHGFSLR